MQIDCGLCVLRTLEPADAAALAEIGNDRDVWLNLRDRFPYPYHRSHAEAYIARVENVDPPTSLAIVVDGQAAGSVSLHLGSDIERVNGEIGYWLGKPY